MAKSNIKSSSVSVNKKLLIISVIAVVVVGVAALVRSFAATADITFSPANNNLKLSGGASLVGDSQKNGVQVVKLPKGASVATAYFNGEPSGNICANVKADANIGNGTGAIMGIGYTTPKGGEQSIGVQSTWSERCLNFGGNTGATAYIKNNSNVTMYVSYIVYRAPVATPVVTATTSKNGGK